MASMLIKAGANVLLLTHDLASTRFLSATLQVNVRDEKGFTPLYIACGYSGYEELVTTLISNGADVKLRTNGDATRTLSTCRSNF